MSTYLISDIHGCNATFRRALKSIKFKKTDTIYILGDLIDRGFDSKGVLDTVFLLLEHGFSVYAIRGNHEQMMLDARNDVSEKVRWIRNGGKETLKSFLTSDIDRVPEKYTSYLESLPNFIELGKYIFVHGGIKMTSKDPLSDVESLLWLRDSKAFFNKEWLGNREVIHGHTPISKKSIKEQFVNSDSILCIDNGVYMKSDNGYGNLCVLRLDDRHIYFEENITI